MGVTQGTVIKPAGDPVKPFFGMNYFQLLGLFLGPVILLILWFTPIQGLSVAARHALGISLMTATWWIFTVMPPVIPALIACILLMVTGTVPAEKAFSGYSSASIWMFPFGLIMAQAVDVSGLGKRLVTMVITSVNLTFGRLIGMFILLCFAAPFLIPSAVAYVALLMALAVGILDAVGVDKTKRTELSAALTCFIAIFALLMGRIPLTGSVASFIAVGLTKTIAGVEIAWLDWLACMWIAAPIPMIATWLYVTRVYKPEVDISSPAAKEKLMEQRQALGKISANEIRTAILVSSALILWITGSRTGINTTAVGALVAGMLLLPGIGFLTFENFKKLPWHVFIFGGANFSIGVVLNDTGFAKWAANYISGLSILSTGNFLVTGFVLIVIVFILHIILETMAEISLLTPLLLQANILPAKAIAMLVPYGAGMYIFPYQGTPIILSLGFGTATWSDITKYGFFISGVIFLQALLFLAIYWPYAMG
ncbi:MAG: putative malate transporter YflS [Pelotomaculum sp. PtaB.Bin104]|nr:MAG: putative malate transporter YflS [Pelotomaculum sp. PtaB.Bin104]